MREGTGSHRVIIVESQDPFQRVELLQLDDGQVIAGKQRAHHLRTHVSEVTTIVFEQALNTTCTRVIGGSITSFSCMHE